MKCSIIVIQETWKYEFGESLKLLLRKKGKVAYYFSRAKKKKVGRMKAGAACIINENLVDKVSHFYINERIFVIRLYMPNGMKYVFISVYLPANGNVVEYDLVLQQVSQTIINYKKYGKIVILGDFNGDITRQYDVDNALRVWMRQENLISLDSQFRQVASNTFLDARGNTSWIDHILVSPLDNWNEIIQCNINLSKNEYETIVQNHMSLEDIIKTNWDCGNFGDHRPITLTLATNFNVFKTVEEKTYKGMIDWLNSNHVEEYSKQVERECADVELLAIVDAMVTCPTNENAELVIKAIEKVVIQAREKIEISLTKIINKNAKRYYQKSEADWSLELEALFERRKVLWKKWLETRTDYVRVALAFTRTEIKRIRNQRDKKISGRNFEYLMHLRKTNKIGFWKRLKKMRRKAESVGISQEILTDHYEKTFNECIRNPINHDFDEMVDKEVAEKTTEVLRMPRGNVIILEDEVRDILKALPNGKAAGKAGIRNEMLKYANNNQITSSLTNLISCIINDKIMPTNMNVGVIVTILKDRAGPNDNIDNTRPITLSDTISGIFEFYLLSVMSKTPTSKGQFGFKKNSSTQNAIFLVRETTRILKEKKRFAYIAFCDFSKAFDRVNRSKLLWKLKDNTNPYIWLAIKNYFQISYACTYDENLGLSRLFKTTIGVKQGGQWSPDSFCKYIDEVLIRLQRSGLLIKIKRITIGRIGYADDISIIATTIKKLNAALRIVSDYCSQYDIIINQKKTEWMKLGERVPLDGSVPDPLEGEEVIFGGKSIKKVNKFKFLGFWIRPNVSNKEHLKRRKAAAMSVIGQLNSLGLNHDKTDPEGRGTLIQAFVRPRLLYATENCALTKSDVAELVTFEAFIVKHSYGLAGKSMNTPLIAALGITSLERQI